MTSKRRPLVAANWKMNGSLTSNEEWVNSFVPKAVSLRCDVVVCAPFVYLCTLGRSLAPAGLGAQDVSERAAGAFTGDVSAEMLADIGCRWVIVGRHPHLFPALHTTPDDSEQPPGGGGQTPSGREGTAQSLSADQVKANWEKLKLRERGHEDAPSVLDGLPPGMPALIMAFRMQERAAGIGFEWPDVAGPLARSARRPTSSRRS